MTYDEILASYFVEVGNRPDIAYDCDDCGVHEYSEGQGLRMYENGFGVYCEYCVDKHIKIIKSKIC